MSERIINGSWRLAVLSLILAVSAAALAMAYKGALDLINLEPMGAIPIVSAVMSGAAAWWLARNRNDLVGME
jgi:predicted ATPase